MMESVPSGGATIPERGISGACLPRFACHIPLWMIFFRPPSHVFGTLLKRDKTFRSATPSARASPQAGSFQWNLSEHCGGLCAKSPANVKKGFENSERCFLLILLPSTRSMCRNMIPGYRCVRYSNGPSRSLSASRSASSRASSDVSKVPGTSRSPVLQKNEAFQMSSSGVAQRSTQIRFRGVLNFRKVSSMGIALSPLYRHISALRQRGYRNVWALQGGLDAWNDSKLPLD
jgi:hypothetical protein